MFPVHWKFFENGMEIFRLLYFRHWCGIASFQLRTSCNFRQGSLQLRRTGECSAWCVCVSILCLAISCFSSVIRSSSLWTEPTRSGSSIYSMHSIVATLQSSKISALRGNSRWLPHFHAFKFKALSFFKPVLVWIVARFSPTWTFYATEDLALVSYGGELSFVYRNYDQVNISFV